MTKHKLMAPSAPLPNVLQPNHHKYAEALTPAMPKSHLLSGDSRRTRGVYAVRGAKGTDAQGFCFTRVRHSLRPVRRTPT